MPKPVQYIPLTQWADNNKIPRRMAYIMNCKGRLKTIKQMGQVFIPTDHPDVRKSVCGRPRKGE